jgi:hypothetical protein
LPTAMQPRRCHAPKTRTTSSSDHTASTDPKGGKKKRPPFSSTAKSSCVFDRGSDRLCPLPAPAPAPSCVSVGHLGDRQRGWLPNWSRAGGEQGRQNSLIVLFQRSFCALQGEQHPAPQGGSGGVKLDGCGLVSLLLCEKERVKACASCRATGRPSQLFFALVSVRCTFEARECECLTCAVLALLRVLWPPLSAHIDVRPSPGLGQMFGTQTPRVHSRLLCWQMETEETLLNSPSARDGIAYDVEWRLRGEGIGHMIQTGRILNM